MSPARTNNSADGIRADMLAHRTGGHWHADNAASAMVTSIEIDSRKCSDGTLFVALPGAQADGHNFIAAAARQGAPEFEQALARGVVGRGWDLLSLRREQASLEDVFRELTLRVPEEVGRG